MPVEKVAHYPHQQESSTKPDILITYDDGTPDGMLFNEMLIGAWLWVQRGKPVPEDIAQDIRAAVALTTQKLPGQLQEKMSHWEPERQTLFNIVFSALGIVLE